MPVVAAVLITALGAIVVAFVALVGTRVEARDARSRLVKDVDVMLKLPDGSRARRILEGHVTRSAANLIASDEKRWHFRRGNRFFVLSIITMAIGFALIVAMGGPEHKSIAETARSGALEMGYVFIAFAYVSVALCVFYLWRGIRNYSKKAGHRDKNQESKTAQKEGDDDDAPSGPDGQGD